MARTASAGSTVVTWAPVVAARPVPGAYATATSVPVDRPPRSRASVTRSLCRLPPTASQGPRSADGAAARRSRPARGGSGCAGLVAVAQQHAEIHGVGHLLVAEV